MKLGPDMYHLNIFHFHTNEGGSEWTGRGRIRKTINKCDEINKISTLTSPNNSLQNTMNFEIFFTVIFNNLHLVLTRHNGRGSLTSQMGQKGCFLFFFFRKKNGRKAGRTCKIFSNLNICLHNRNSHHALPWISGKLHKRQVHTIASKVMSNCLIHQKAQL